MRNKQFGRVEMCSNPAKHSQRKQPYVILKICIAFAFCRKYEPGLTCKKMLSTFHVINCATFLCYFILIIVRVIGLLFKQVIPLIGPTTMDFSLIFPTNRPTLPVGFWYFLSALTLYIMYTYT